MKDTVRTWLEEDRVDVFLGYKLVDGHPLPHLFTKANLKELDQMVASTARYPLEKLISDFAPEAPGLKIGFLGRDCNQRALNVLVLANQLDPDRVKALNVNCCPSKSREHADCSHLEPEQSGAFKKLAGIDRNAEVEEIEALPREERFNRWMYEFQKCIRCYGCRNICPVCYCDECSLESSELVEKGPIPPEVPLFHIVRAVHMAGRCIDCGLCEDACPVDIPLRLLYKKVNSTVKKLFDYDAGVTMTAQPLAVSNPAGPPSHGHDSTV